MDFIIPPVAVRLNAAAGGGAQTLQPGQVIEALVARVIDPAHVQLMLGATLIDVQTAVPLIAGSRVQLAVKAAPDGMRLVLVDPTSSASGQASAPGAASTSAGKMTPAIMTGPANAAHDASALPTSINAAPAAALASAVRSAAVTQSGLAPLLADAAAAVNLKSLPEPVRQAVLKLMSFQLPSETVVEADQLRRAFMRSGLFLEANLENASAKSSPTAAPTPAGDLKAALVTLRAALTQASGGLQTSASSGQATASAADAVPSGSLAPPLEAAAGRAAITDAQGLYRALLQAAGETGTASATSPTASSATPGASRPDANQAAPFADNRPPPPYRGALPAAQRQALPSADVAQSPDKILQALLAETEGALARQTLLQAASLPDQPGVTADVQKFDANLQRWAFEIPFATPQGPAIAQFEIAGDAHGRGQDHVAPIWRARFAIDIEPLGAIHAQVAVMGERTAVTLWAERADSASLIRDNAAALADGLRAAELEPLEVIVRDGAPRLRAPAARTAGHFVDRAS